MLSKYKTLQEMESAILTGKLDGESVRHVFEKTMYLAAKRGYASGYSDAKHEVTEDIEATVKCELVKPCMMCQTDDAAIDRLCSKYLSSIKERSQP